MSSGRKTPSKTPTPKHISNLSDNQISLLPDLGKSWVKVGRFFALDPARAHLPNAIPPGLYSYIQLKKEPRTIFLMFTNSYLSLHPKQTEYAGLTPADLLSGGEIAIGGHGQVAAWAFRTGYLYGVLGLANPDLEGPLMQAVGMPVDDFYAVEDWIAFKEGGINHFAAFFTPYGLAKTINQPSKLLASIKDVAENIQQQREIRNAQEEIVIQGLPAAQQKLYKVLQTNRDEYELHIQGAIKTSGMPRSISSGSVYETDKKYVMPRSVSAGSVDENEKKASLARLEAELPLQSQSDPQKVRTLSTEDLEAKNLPGTISEVSLIMSTHQFEPTGLDTKTKGYSPKDESALFFPSKGGSGGSPIFFESTQAIKTEDLAADEARKIAAFDLVTSEPTSAVVPSFGVIKSDHRIPLSEKAIAEPVPKLSRGSDEKEAGRVIENPRNRGAVEQKTAPFRLFHTRAEIDRARREKSVVVNGSAEVIDEAQASCCLRIFGFGRD
jgi:hypothetical protein